MIQPDKASIDDIFTDSKVKYIIPKYQREFDWGKNEITELIDDLKDVVSSENELYLGSFIFDSSNKGFIEIVDGQQRMTSLSLIVIAVREHAKRINEKEYAGEMQQFLTFKSAWSSEGGNRLTVSPSVRNIFDFISSTEWDGKFPDTIDGKGVKRQVNRVKPIYDYVMHELEEYNISSLREFLKAIMTSYVTVLYVDGVHDVFSIFERTNARGLDLNIGDLLKNYIYSHGVEEYEQPWLDIISRADGSVPRMFKYFWISRKGHIRQSELYKNLRTYGKTKGIEVFIEELNDFSKFYSMVRNADIESVRAWLNEFKLTDIAGNTDAYTRISRVLEALKMFRVTQAYPMIFSIFHLYRKKPGNKDKLIEVLSAIEKYHFINNVIVGRIGNEVEQFYAEKAASLYEEKEDFKSNATAIIQDLRAKRATKAEFCSSFIENVRYDDRDTSLINYIFDRTNNYKSKGAQLVRVYEPDSSISTRNYNVDHILAQTYEDDYEMESDKGKFHEIGNLIVLARHSNSEFQAMTPYEKARIIASNKKHYGNLSYIDDFLEDYSEDFPTWDFDKISKRSQDIAEKSYSQVWNI